jgi:hypothetical protein
MPTNLDVFLINPNSLNANNDNFASFLLFWFRLGIRIKTLVSEESDFPSSDKVHRPEFAA